MKRHGRTKAIVTDGLRSYGAALEEIGTERQEGGLSHADVRSASPPPLHRHCTRRATRSHTASVVCCRQRPA